MTFIEECECTLLGEILLKPEIFRECVLYLTPESFSLPEAKRIYTIFTHIFNEGRQIDPFAVISETGSEKEQYKSFLLDCRKLAVSAENFNVLIKQIHNASIRRRTAAVCNEVISNIDTADIDEVREKISSVLSSFDRTDTAQSENINGMYAEFMKYLSRTNPEIKTGFQCVDNVVTIDRGDFVVIGGRPSSGKTALALQIAMNTAKTHKVVFFSLETSGVKLFTRMLSAATETDIRTLRNRQLITSQNDETKKLWKKINEFTLDADNNINFTFVNAAGWTVPQIRSKALQLGAEVIFIDYLTLIRDSSKSSYERATSISMQLHTLAQRECITVFALAQLNRQSEYQDYPTMADLRESGQIEQDADSIILLSPKRDGDTSYYAPRTLYIVKNKDGDTGETDLVFQGIYQKFVQE